VIQVTKRRKTALKHIVTHSGSDLFVLPAIKREKGEGGRVESRERIE
jgi:hypothetical protein